MPIFYEGDDVTDLIKGLDISKFSANKKRLISNLLIDHNKDNKEAINEIIKKFNPDVQLSTTENILSKFPQISNKTAETIGKIGEFGVKKFLSPIREEYLGEKDNFGKTVNKFGRAWEQKIGDPIGEIAGSLAENMPSMLQDPGMPFNRQELKTPPIVKQIVKDLASGVANLPVNVSPADIATLGASSMGQNIAKNVGKDIIGAIKDIPPNGFLSKDIVSNTNKYILQDVMSPKGKRKLIAEKIPNYVKYIDNGKEYIIPREEFLKLKNIKPKNKSNVSFPEVKNNIIKKEIIENNSKSNIEKEVNSKVISEIPKIKEKIENDINILDKIKELNPIEKIKGTREYSATHRELIDKNYIHGFSEITNLLEHAPSKAEGIFSKLYYDFTRKVDLKDKLDLDLLTEYYHRLFKIEMYKNFVNKAKNIEGLDKQFSLDIINKIENEISGYGDLSKDDIIANMERSAKEFEKKVLKMPGGVNRLERLKNNTNELHNFNNKVFYYVAQSFNIGDDVYNVIINKFSHYIPPEAFKDYFGNTIQAGGIFNKTYSDSFIKSRENIFNMPKDDNIIDLIAKDAYMKLHASKKKEAVDSIMHMAEKRGYGKLLPEEYKEQALYLSENKDQVRLMIKGKTYAIHKNIADVLNTAIDMDDKTIDKMLSQINMIARDNILILNPKYAFFKTFVIDMPSYFLFSDSKPKIVNNILQKYNKVLDKTSNIIKNSLKKYDNKSIYNAIDKISYNMKFYTNEEIGVLPTETNLRNYLKGFANSMRMSLSKERNPNIINKTLKNILGGDIDDRYLDRLVEGKIDTVYFPKAKDLIDSIESNNGKNPLKYMFEKMKDIYKDTRDTIGRATVGAHDDAMKYMAAEQHLQIKYGVRHSLRIDFLNNMDEVINENRKELSKILSLNANKKGEINYFSDVQQKNIKINKNKIIEELENDYKKLKLERENILTGKYGDIEQRVIDNFVDAENAIRGKTLSLNIKKTGRVIQKLKYFNLFINPMIREVSKVSEIKPIDKKYFLIKSLLLYYIFNKNEKDKISEGNNIYIDPKISSQYLLIDSGIDVIDKDNDKRIFIAIGNLNPLISSINYYAISNAREGEKFKRFGTQSSVKDKVKDYMVMPFEIFYNSFSLYSPLNTIWEASRGVNAGGYILRDRSKTDLPNYLQYNKDTKNIYRGIAGLSQKVFGDSPVSPVSMEHVTKGIIPTVDMALSMADDYVPTFGVPKKKSISDDTFISNIPGLKAIKKQDPYEYFFKKETNKLKEDSTLISDNAKIAFSIFQPKDKRDEALLEMKKRIDEISKDNPGALIDIKDKINDVINENKKILSEKDIALKIITIKDINNKKDIINEYINSKIEFWKKKVEHGKQ